jgi:hypothetical protein
VGSKPPFLVIDGTPPPDTHQERLRKRLRAQPKPEHLIRCRRCTGISVIETKLGMTFRNGKAVGGQKQLICAICSLQDGRPIQI